MLATPGGSDAVLDRVYVSLDLETTGLDVDRDVIIQVGAVKFRGTEVLDTFDHLVNPYRMLPNFITQLTGITQSDVDEAAPWPEVAEPLLAFLGDYPLVGHSISFDLAMLSRAALNLTNARYDTHDLATVFIPKATEYSLTGPGAVPWHLIQEGAQSPGRRYHLPSAVSRPAGKGAGYGKGRIGSHVGHC